ncbi:hypothetical protein TSO221_33780 [Azospirillum sp. TSO22-1]|nr:hypothetical protein TSO221_33780 [Azospirillum sp. TSO22-1]
MTAEDIAAQAAALHRQGRFADALDLYGRLLSGQPGNAALQGLIGALHAQMGQAALGVEHLLQSDALAPGNDETLHNLATALAACGRASEAADAWNRLGAVRYQRRDHAGAEAVFRQALALHPGHFGAAANLGASFQAQGRHAEAVALFTTLLDGDADEAEVHNNLGNAHMGAGALDEAIAAYRRAIALRPEYFEAYSNLGLVMARRTPPAGASADADPVSEVRRCYERALALRPDFAAAHWNLSLCLLLQGDYERGWPAYEWRWRWDGFGEAHRPFAQPLWRGEPPQALAGTLLLTAEQGFGDTLQFARYAALLAGRGHDVTLEVQAPLFTLLWTSLGRHGVRVVPRAGSPAQVHDDLPFAAHVPLMSLPARFGTRLDSIPSACPYLFAEPSRVARWRGRLDAAAGPIVKVGLAWSGRPEHARDRERSLPVGALAPLLAVPGVHFFVLHKGGPPVEPRANLTPLGPMLHDFAETAAVVDTLDLVITVDTALAHLTGGLGRRGWVLLPFSPDWRWLLDRDDSPWYPSLTLLRQDTAGDWAPVVAEAARRLHAWVEDGGKDGVPPVRHD